MRGDSAALGVIAKKSQIDAKQMARPERFELPTYWFEASRSIQLS